MNTARLQNLLTKMTIVTLILCAPWAYAQKYELRGSVTDSRTGERLIGAGIYIPNLHKGVVSDAQGEYLISVPQQKGKYKLQIKYIGYQEWHKRVDIHSDTTLDIQLISNAKQLQQVEVNAARTDQNISRNEMSSVQLKARTIEQIPALMGEVDLVKALQLLPGVTASSEGSSAFNVRGGSSDQNLILLDEATIYNASHLMGFFSVFNNEAVRDVTLYKGDIPVRYGGRLSSLLDVRMKQGNSDQLTASGGVGSISSRLSMQMPIGEKTQFMVAGRRSYADLFLKLSSDKDIKESILHFYDINATLYHKINAKNTLSLSLYNGQDKFGNKFSKFYFGNSSLSLNWKRIYSDKIVSNIDLLYSKYNYGIGIKEKALTQFEWKSHIQDVGTRLGFTFFQSPRRTWYCGGEITYHMFKPGSTSGSDDEGINWSAYSLPKTYALEEAIYLSTAQSIGERWQLKYGLRLSAFHNIGPGTVYHYKQNYEKSDSTYYGSSSIYNTYIGLEPRLSIAYRIDSSSSLKAAYSRTRQYMQLSQNSTSGTPLDVWFPSSPNVKPQIADQVSIGYFKNLENNRYETSIELYYKYMQNSVGFKDFANIFLNKLLEGELRFGHAEAYGAEFLLRKNQGRLQGWMSYTYSRVWKSLKGVNNDARFPALYDKPHTVTVVLNYKLHPRLSVAANWVYATGQPATYPVGKAIVNGQVLPIFSERNSERYKDYHRMDMAIIWYSKASDKAYKWDLNFSVYNLYSRHNTWAINFETDEQGNTQAEQTYLFPFIPSITFNFSF